MDNLLFRYNRFVFYVLFLTSCCSPQGKAYQSFYAHLDTPLPKSSLLEPSDFYLVIFVNARHLDYTDCRSFLYTVAKHPSDRSKTGDVGHAWVYLKGIVHGEKVCIEGGHSGELG